MPSVTIDVPNETDLKVRTGYFNNMSLIKGINEVAFSMENLDNIINAMKEAKLKDLGEVI